MLINKRDAHTQSNTVSSIQQLAWCWAWSVRGKFWIPQPSVPICKILSSSQMNAGTCLCKWKLVVDERRGSGQWSCRQRTPSSSLPCQTPGKKHEVSTYMCQEAPPLKSKQKKQSLYELLSEVVNWYNTIVYELFLQSDLWRHKGGSGSSLYASKKRRSYTC